MKDNHLTQQKLADKLEVTRKAVSIWAIGEGAPDKYNYDKICKTFNVSLAWITSQVDRNGFLPCWWDKSLYPNVKEWSIHKIDSLKIFIASCEDDHHKQESVGSTLEEVRNNWNQRG